MAKIVNMLDVPRLYSQKDDRFRYEAVKENVLGLKNICGEIVVYPPGASGASRSASVRSNRRSAIESQASCTCRSSTLDAPARTRVRHSLTASRGSLVERRRSTDTSIGTGRPWRDVEMRSS